MTSPQVVHHALLRPCILHILRAAGYHGTRPSVVDTLTDIAARYMLLLAKTTVEHSVLNHGEVGVAIEDVRMALQDCGAIAPEKVLEDQLFEGEEDTRGVDAFLDWITGLENKEIQRVALEGGDEGPKEDFLTVLKKKFDKTGDETRYQGTLLGKEAETPRTLVIEGSDITTMKEWVTNLKRHTRSRSMSTSQSRRQSSDLSSLDGTMDDDHEMEDSMDL